MPITILCLLLALVSSPALAATTTTVVDIPTPRGVTTRILYVRPDAPKATIVSIPGGNGVYDIQDDGTMSSVAGRCNPPSRNRQALAGSGFAVALVDRASDGRIYQLDDLEAVVQHVRARDAVPVWLMGGSASTEAIALVAASLAATDPTGVVFFSPQNLFASQAAAIRRPTGVVYHPGDPDQFAQAVFQALTSAPVKALMPITAGVDIDCGFHLFQGADAEFVAAVAGFIDTHNGSLASAANYQGLWWNASESGWGINLAHQGDQIYLTWYTYDASGDAAWLALLAAKTPSGSYSGDIVEVRASTPAANPFAPPTLPATVVGTGTLTFSDASTGSFAYTAKGVTQTKSITRFDLGSATCTFDAAPNFAAATNYQDLWWNPAKSGWGINLTHEGSQIYATWYTYDVDGSPLWLASLMSAGAGGTYSGALLRFSGPPFSSVPFPTTATSTNVGNATLTFANGNAATWTYTAGSASGSEPITRYLFARTAGTICR
jgi:hypothetical protein